MTLISNEGAPVLSMGAENLSSAKSKTVAEQALGELLTMPMPKTERDFRRAVIMAALIGRQIEADFQQQ